jgi:hypothetical protein
MAKKQTTHETSIHIRDAVETLSAIADIDFNSDIGVARKHRIVIQDKEIPYHSVHWLSDGEVTTTIRAVRENFKTVLNYIRVFYKRRLTTGNLEDANAIEGIKNIMLLVGEAAKKLDRYTDLFKKHKMGSVRNVREFKQLENFYLKKIVKAEEERATITELFSEKATPIREKTETKLSGKQKTRARLKVTRIDLDSVKKDTEYELFYLRKQDGKRYFDEKLLRNIKLICDFSRRLPANTREDHLTKLPMWEDQISQVDACNIRTAAHQEIEV